MNTISPIHDPHDIDRMATAAAAAFPALARAPGLQRATLLRAMASRIEAIGDPLIDCVCEESALHRPRVLGERARTTAQLRLFADVADADQWRDPRTDPGDTSRQPTPRPMLHSERRPIGPVAVFGASNFPLAFSIAGGDTASALAVGCPVIAKAHPAHPRTCRLIGDAIAQAVRDARFPDAVFQVFFESGIDAGSALVAHPNIKAAAFTGSRRGGLALWRIAQERTHPIPFFGELSSINPVFITSARAIADAEALATGLATSMTLGVGQFCTQPGVIVVPRDSAGMLCGHLIDRIRQTAAGTMLTEAMSAHYRDHITRLLEHPGIVTLAEGQPVSSGRQAQARLIGCTMSTFLDDASLQEEVFGPASLFIEVDGPNDFVRLIDALDGQLTATLWHEPGERTHLDALLWAMEQKVGRIVFNGYPTGVEVGTATVHGGPFPASTDARFTSVGTRAIDRFLRVVAWQEPA